MLSLKKSSEDINSYVIYFILLINVIQVGCSKMYINSITYTYNNNVGLYLFAFVLTNILFIFALFSMKSKGVGFHPSIIIVTILTGLFAIGMLKVFYKETMITKTLRINDIYNSSIVMTISLILILLSVIMLFISNNRMKKEK